MTATIPSAQLEAITRLELAAIALQKAQSALEHPDLQLGSYTALAPSGHKHVAQITELAANIEAAIAPKTNDESVLPSDAYELLAGLIEHYEAAVTAFQSAESLLDAAVDDDVLLDRTTTEYQAMFQVLLNLADFALSQRLTFGSLATPSRIAS